MRYTAKEIENIVNNIITGEMVHANFEPLPSGGGVLQHKGKHIRRMVDKVCSLIVNIVEDLK